MSTLTFELNKMKAEKIMDGKSWFCSIVTYPFYEDILEIEKDGNFEGMSLFMSILL